MNAAFLIPPNSGELKYLKLLSIMTITRERQPDYSGREAGECTEMQRDDAMDEQALQALSRALTHLVFRNGIVENLIERKDHIC